MPRNPVTPKRNPAPRRTRCANARRKRSRQPQIDDRLVPVLIAALEIAGACVASAAASLPYPEVREAMALSAEEKDRLTRAGVAIARCCAAAGSPHAEGIGLAFALTGLAAAKVELVLVGAAARAQDDGAEPEPLSPLVAALLALLILAPLAILGFSILHERKKQHAQ